MTREERLKILSLSSIPFSKETYNIMKMNPKMSYEDAKIIAMKRIANMKRGR